MVSYDSLSSFCHSNMAYMAVDAPVFPAALPEDGCIDLISVGSITSRTSVPQSLHAIEKGSLTRNEEAGGPHRRKFDSSGSRRRFIAKLIPTVLFSPAFQ